MATMTVTLTPEQSAQVQTMLDSGRFESMEEAVAFSIDTIAHESTSLSQYSSETLNHLDRSIAEIQRGELVPQGKVEEFFTEWRNDLVK